jgi:hypothetical protein
MHQQLTSILWLINQELIQKLDIRRQSVLNWLMSRQPTMNSTIMLLFASVFLFTSIATCSAEKSLIDELKQMSVFELR